MCRDAKIEVVLGGLSALESRPRIDPKTLAQREREENILKDARELFFDIAFLVIVGQYPSWRAMNLRNATLNRINGGTALATWIFYSHKTA